MTGKAKSGYTVRGSVTTEDVVNAAIELADGQGIENVTWRALGEAVGMHHTSVYRQFADMSELMGLVFEALVARALTAVNVVEADPAVRLQSLGLSLRTVLREHPTLVPSMVNAGGQLPRSLEYMGLALGCLREMGLDDDDLAVWYQLVETHTMGSSLYDFAGAPAHLEARRVRYRMFEDPALDSVSRTAGQISEVNEAAFERGLVLIIAAARAAAPARAAIPAGGRKLVPRKAHAAAAEQ